MPSHVALLRAINVGGVTLAMSDLRAAAESLGHTDVATYLQPGNLVLTPVEPRQAAELASALTSAIEARAGIAPAVIVVTADEWNAIVSANPYPEETEGTHLHAVVAESDYTPEQIEAAATIRDTARAAGSADDLTVVGRVAYLHLPHGIGRSVLAAKVTRSARTGMREATARNWRTVLAVQTMLGA